MNPAAVAIAAIATGLGLLFFSKRSEAMPNPSPDPSVPGDPVDDSQARGDANMRAFLAMVRKVESDDSYGAYYGEHGNVLADLSDHPINTGERKFVEGPNGPTSAAGAYQITHTTWQDLGGVAKYGSFDAAAQDQAALDRIRWESGLEERIRAGNFGAALSDASRIWASLPRNRANVGRYADKARRFDEVLALFEQNGGTVT